MPLRILVVDDDPSVRHLLMNLLTDKHTVREACDGKTALELSSIEPFDLVLCDIRLNGLSGFEVLRSLKGDAGNQAEIVMMTGFGGLDSVVQATHHGALDYLTKPFSMDQILNLVTAIEERKSPNNQQAEIMATLPISDNNPLSNEITGVSPAMIELYKYIARVAATDLTVTIYGESGTGKEMVARTIHRHSARKSKPFIAVNCGALTESLLESELFGHQRGAFTGALASRRGLFEEADGGTLFLDEIGETSLAFQVKLLRALQEGEIKPVGSNDIVRVNVRVITASNVDLRQLVRNKRFREDLLYRINAMTLEIPPLRERREDIALLIQRFAAQVQRQFQSQEAHSLTIPAPFSLSSTDPLLTSASSPACRKKQLTFTPAALQLMMQYDWPGNVRQLQNTIYRLVALTGGRLIQERDLPAEISQPTALALPLEIGTLPQELISFQELQRRYLTRVLSATSGNKVRAARILGVDRKTVDRLARNYDIAIESFRK
jgi:DNA-binding NtrC family response regulator